MAELGAEAAPIGYVVLTYTEGMGWQDDWDGRVHVERHEGITELMAASHALGQDHVRLAALYEEVPCG